MIASEVTINDEFFGFVKTKFNKNINEFMSDYCFRQGKTVEKYDEGFVAELHSASSKNNDEVRGKIYVIY